MERKIIHIDMDAFFAAVEQLDQPELQNKPVAVGGGEERGVVAAASYEARKFGVRSAMNGPLARKLCPDLIFVSPNFERYKEVSMQIRTVFNKYTDLVEPLSLDEAYLDVTKNKMGRTSATQMAREIRFDIKNLTGLNASAGISINKFLAKIASDWNKPNGQKTIAPEEVLPFLEKLDVKKFYGVGKKTGLKMYQMGIFDGVGLKTKSIEFLNDNFGKSGTYFYNVVRGIHDSPVIPFRTPKSFGAEHTFTENLTSEVYLEEKLKRIANKLEKRLKIKKLAGRTLTLKIKFSDFSVQTRSKTFPHYIADRSLILSNAKELLHQEKLVDSVRLLGLSLSNLNTEKKEEKLKVQLSLPF
jgi:DNA polymerase-4